MKGEVNIMRLVLFFALLLCVVVIAYKTTTLNPLINILFSVVIFIGGMIGTIVVLVLVCVIGVILLPIAILIFIVFLIREFFKRKDSR